MKELSVTQIQTQEQSEKKNILWMSIKLCVVVEPCAYPISQLEKVCRPSYSFLTQDEEDYLKGWKSVNESGKTC